MSIQPFITIDSLTAKDFERIRIKKKRLDQDNLMDFGSFCQEEIRKYNLGLDSVIETKDAFTEEFIYKAPVSSSDHDEPTSNIGKDIYVEFIYDQFKKFTLVASSEDPSFNPDNNIISVESDLGKKLEYAKQDEMIEFKDSIIDIIRIRPN